MRVWLLLRKADKIICDTMVEATGILEALQAGCEKLDCPHPIILEKHKREFNQFGKTRFKRDDFIEMVHFDTLEADTLKNPGKSSDVRNAAP